MKVKTVDLEMFSPDVLQIFKELTIFEMVKDYIEVLRSTIRDAEKGSLVIVRKLFTCGEYTSRIFQELYMCVEEKLIEPEEYEICTDELERITTIARDIIRGHLMKRGLL